MISKNLNSFKKSPLLAFIKFEPTFLTGSLAVCLSAPVIRQAHDGEFIEPFPPSLFSFGRAGKPRQAEGIGGIPPAEPSQFRSDIFKQTPPVGK
jgi:hypothetical protein